MTGHSMLLCDDEPALAEEIAEFFTSLGWSVRTCADGLAAERLLSGGLAPSCLVTDLHMPGGGGETLLAVVRSLPPEKQPAVVAVMTGHALEGTTAGAFGADLLYRKPADPFVMAEDLASRLRASAIPPSPPAGAERSILIIEDDPMIRKELAAFLEGFGHQVATSAGVDALDQRPQSAFDVLILDLHLVETDGLKILHGLRDRAVVPDVLLLSGHGESVLKAATTVAERLGLTVLGAYGKPVDPDALARSVARRGLDAAPRDIRTSDPDAVRGALVAALDAGGIPIAFQPKMCARTLVFAGAEALLAGTLPGLDPVRPQDIVAAAAASTELLVRLTLSVLEQAVSGCVRWRHLGWQGPVSVNLPVEVLLAPDAVGTLERVTRAGGLGPADVTFELIEDAVYDSSTAALAALAQLRLAGFGLSLDDVGRRQSGLLQLANLPVSEIKIDIEILRQARTWGKAREIFASLAALGRRLGVAVVAEGVEEDVDLALVRAHSVDYVQGFLISPKRPLDDMLALGLEFEQLRRRYCDGREAAGDEDWDSRRR